MTKIYDLTYIDQGLFTFLFMLYSLTQETNNKTVVYHTGYPGLKNINS